MSVMDEVSNKLKKEATDDNLKAIAIYIELTANQNEDLRSMILDDSKTVAKAYEFIKSKAKSMAAKGGCVGMDGRTVCRLAGEYYGLISEVNEEIYQEADKQINIINNQSTTEKVLKAPDRSVIPQKAKPQKKVDELAGQMDLFSFLN